MTTYIYVGPTSAGLADGTSWANRYGTLNAAEDRPIVADTVVYVGPGTYRELLTCDVSGAAGQAISYIGDFTGANTDGTGGVVRITGAAAGDTTAGTRVYCINVNGKGYRTFRGFTMDGASGHCVYDAGAGTDVTIDECFFVNHAVSQNSCVNANGAGQARWAISNCKFLINSQGDGIDFAHGATVDNTAHAVTNCIFVGGYYGVRSQRVGGITVNNCKFITTSYATRVHVALTVGQLLTVTNSIYWGNQTALWATTTAEFSENYNDVFAASTARTNVNVGANSIAYPWLPDTRWFHEATTGGRFVTPFDMASYCALVDVAGTSPPAADLRGTTVQGAEREWGALEYDSTLLIESAAGGGGPVRILPIRGSVG